MITLPAQVASNTSSRNFDRVNPERTTHQSLTIIIASFAYQVSVALGDSLAITNGEQNNFKITRKSNIQNLKTLTSLLPSMHMRTAWLENDFHRGFQLQEHRQVVYQNYKCDAI